MPLNKPAFRSKLSDHCRRKGFILAYFSAFSLLVFLAFVIFRSTFERIIKIQEDEIGEPKANIADYKQALINSEKTSVSTKTEHVNTNFEKYDEWCQARDYIDLSNHEIFKKFDQWLVEYEKLNCVNEINCTIHDPKIVAQIHQQGRKLAKQRKEVLLKIIRGDPEKAISIAIKTKYKDLLPKIVKEHVESWHSEKIDLKAIHVCFDKNHPEGLVKRFATLSNGLKVKVWAYGERAKAKTIDGLGVWGISLGNDFAIAENSYREIVSVEGNPAIEFAGNIYPYDYNSEKELFIDELERAERRVSFISKRVSYPIMAGSSSLSDYYDKKYDLILTPMSWKDANDTAFAENGRLVIIESEKENNFIHDQYRNAEVSGFDTSGNPVKLGWIGATDNEDQNGTNFDAVNNTSSIVEINATEGDWAWLDGKDINETISDFDPQFNAMWLGGVEPNNTSRDFGAMKWDTLDGNWTDANETYRLPFVIEYDLGNEPAPNLVAAKGFRKVLVVPARFQDEGYGINGYSAPLTDQFGNPIFPELQNDSFEPVSQSNLASAMDEVVRYFSENSDGIFNIIPVISPTVTIPLDKYAPANPGEGNLFDSSGQYIGSTELESEELDMLGGIGELGVMMAAQEGDAYNIFDHNFWGVSSISLAADIINGPEGPYESAPSITFTGGSENPNDSNLSNPDFQPCEARAVLNANGQITAVEILNPGTWYYSNPTVLVNGVASAEITATASNIGISWVTISTHTPGAAGLGYVGSAGSHVDAAGGNVSWSVIAHELGHNFGLLHANRFYSLSERPNSDEGFFDEYGNPFAVMGSGSGHMTLPAKVAMAGNGFGYHLGTHSGVDVADLTSSANLDNAVANGLNINLSDNNNTFRIYRHDFKTFPASLIEQNFYVFLPDAVFLNYDGEFERNETYNLHFDGSGDGATGILVTNDTNLADLTILEGGIGFSDDPAVDVTDENNQTIFRIDPSWIKVKAGTGEQAFDQAVLRDLSDSSVRGLRGLKFLLSQHSPIGTDSGENMRSMWLAYRRTASNYYPSGENGLCVLLGDGATENFWIDMTPKTLNDFSDAFLMPGITFSDYSTDVHVTPVSKGGMEPMEYINVVVNIGTVNDGSANAPILDLELSNLTPNIGEFVELTASVQNGKATDYAYAWYVNEVHQTGEYALNRPNFFKNFNESGEYAVRVVVSDMKGGVASRTVVLKVGEYQNAKTSSITGTVRSNDGFIQGARVIISPAEVIEHTISLTGNSKDFYLPTGRSNPQRFLIDGMDSPHLTLRRGEIHRFKFEASADGMPLSFFDHPEHEMPRIRLKMLVDPRVDKPGDKYTKPPEIKVVGGSMFANYLNDKIATIAEFNGTNLLVSENQPFEISRPFAKALLSETNVTAVRVRPLEINEFGIYNAHGGFAHHRNNPPTVTIHRSSFWEDYTEPNATAKAYVDGVGTISPVIANNGLLGNRWERRTQGDPTPELVIWGSGSEANASVLKTTRTVGNKTIYDHTIQIIDQGAGFEPNATMAVLHYPTEPLAMWTFDKHESLYDSNDTRFHPSPAWNRELTEGLVHYWSFDEENGTTVFDQIGNDHITVGELSENNRSVWGAKGRAIYLNSSADSITSSVSVTDQNFTLSMWLKPKSQDFATFDIGGSGLSYDHSDREYSFNSTDISRLSEPSKWSHLAFTGDGGFYVDGIKSFATAATSPAIITDDFNGSIDEMRVYSRILSEAEVRYLAGRSFLDLSGNKFHAVAVGGNFLMSDPTSDSGSSSGRPTVELKGNNQNLPRALGDSTSGEGNGRSVTVSTTESYLDISSHISEFEGLSEGTISFWVKPSGSGDRTIFSASDSDKNQTHFRIKLRGNAGPVQLTAVNDGVKVSEFYTNVNLSSGTIDWRHVALVVNQNQAAFWVDGNVAGSVATPDGPGATRAFFSDIEGINFMSIGLHKDLNVTNSFNGSIDDFYIYDRALDASEISFLYNLRQGRDQVPRLEALADAVGTIKIITGGAGYKELPEAQFSFGMDGNLTSDLAQTEPLSPNYGDLYYDNATKEIFSYYVGYAGDQNEGEAWRDYHQAFGTPELNGTIIDRILWTKDTFKANILRLPNDRNVTRRYVEYVVQGDGEFASPSMDFGTPEGIFGYSAVPDLEVEASPSEERDDDASAYVIFFLNLEESPVIENPGHGLTLSAGEFADKVRVSGKGFRPAQNYRVQTTDADGNISWINVEGSSVEQWYRNNNDENKTLLYKLSERDTQNSTGAKSITEIGDREFGPNDEVLFSDWAHDATTGEPRNVIADFNQTLSHVVVENPGFGYSVPLSVQLIGGYPVGSELEQWFEDNRLGETNNTLRALPYTFEPAIVEVNGTNPADGSITSFDIVNPGRGYIVAPMVVITGGGGNGAEAIATIDANGSIANVSISEDLFTGEVLAGRGYFNTDLSNSPDAQINHTPAINLQPGAKDANISVLLGGSLSGIELCPCTDHTHMDPFIEIWDRNRSETDIDNQDGARARAVAKVRNGVIEKVIVLESGRGYVDPVVYVRGSPNNKDIPNNRSNYFGIVNGVRQRQWRCTNLRESVDGSIAECGHIQMGLYPPEKCPGDNVDNHIPVAGYDDSDHVNKTFKTTTCTGTKASYVLINDPYRYPYEDWQPWDAKLVALSEGGKIKEIVVLDGGNMYGSTQVAVSGSGGGVDVVAAFDDEGKNTHVLFDDPTLKNLETDVIPRPLGAGQGFMERPWSWDNNHEPTYGFREVVSTMSVGSDELGTALFGAPTLSDNLGDRVVDVRINEIGNFASNSLDIDVTFDPSQRPDLNKDGAPDFVQATLSGFTTRRLVSLVLDGNGTFQDDGGLAGTKFRSLYLEEPNLNLLLDENDNNVLDENLTNTIRLNGLIDFDAVAERGYFDLYVDDRLPETFYYGFSGDDLSGNPAMGGKITVTEGLPGMNWATSITNSLSKSTMTDQNGFYSLSGLEPGLYNVAVLMEDKNFQESTFRPESNSTHVTEVLYIPGMPELVMESDQRGQGASRMIWSRDTRKIARPANQFVNEETTELKTIEGVGFGFTDNTLPELIFTPHKDNTSSTVPNVSVSVLVDGSLSLRIIDDENSTKFNSTDSFTVSFSSSISGVDFREDFLHSESDGDMWSGSGASRGYDQSRLIILPNDGNGSNFVEVPLSTSAMGEQPFTFSAVAYDQDGNQLDVNGVEWEIIFEGNKSEVAELNTTVGGEVNLSLYSTLKRGKVDSVKIISSGSQYTSGSKVRLTGPGSDFNATIISDPLQSGNYGIVDINITNAGTGYNADSILVIEDPRGINGSLLPILGGGTLTLKATLPLHGLETSVNVLASSRNKLSSREKWLDQYLDSFSQMENAWWSDDNDSDGLSNNDEYKMGTNPLKQDTDGDGLTDSDEAGMNTNPKSMDTDNDGIKDNEDLLPLIKNTANLSGNIIKEGDFVGDLYFRIQEGEELGDAVFFDQNESFSKVFEINSSRENQFPYPFQYSTLLTGTHWKISAFVDSDGDQSYDATEEVFGEWQGQLNDNISSANILLKNYPPYFEVSGLEKFVKDRGETISLAISAYDYPNQSWDDLSFGAGNSTRTIKVSGTALEILEINGTLADIAVDAPFGNYELIYEAIDSLGSISEPISRELQILDANAPVIIIPAATYQWPFNVEFNSSGLFYQAFEAKDYPSEKDLTNRVVVTGEVDVQTMGTYELSLYVEDDAGRSSESSLIIQISDQTAPVISFSDDGPINYLLGLPFLMPENYITAIDDVDGNVTLSVQIDGIESLDPNSTLIQTITVNVTDSSGNLSSENLEIQFEEPTFTLSGLAIDGYLQGSSVSFIPAAEGVDQSLLLATTDQDGAFSIQFLGDVFQQIDLNNNGALDPDEGYIEVSGGIDSSTNREFTGQLKADADSSVVTPLTTLVNEMIANGEDKETALLEIADAFGYSSEIDITKYNPFEAAGTGDEASKKILQSGALVANMMKQAEAFAKISGIDAVEGTASAAIAKDLTSLASQGKSVNSLLVQQNEVSDMVKRALLDVSEEFEVDEDELDLFSGVATASNVVMADGSLTNFSPAEMVSKLIGRQIAVEEEVIVGLQNVSEGTASLTGLSLNTDAASLIEIANNLPVTGQFPPAGVGFSAYLEEEDIIEGLVIKSLEISDPDGENVSAELTFGNLDLNQNGISAFLIDTNSRLVVGDSFDAKESLSGGPIQLTISLTDTSGMTSQFAGIVSFVGKTDVSSLGATPQNQSDWYEVDWLGSFYAGKNGWLYHNRLGWIYLSPSEGDGFWIWNESNGWWWTKDNIFPYAYKFSTITEHRGWLYFDVETEPMRTYEFFNGTWK